MNVRILFAVTVGLPVLVAQPADRYAGERPPVTIAGEGAESVPSGGASSQRLYAPGASLVPPEQAREIVEKFRAAYDRLGKPRLVLAVNRELVDAESGLRLSARKEKTESVRTDVSGDLTPTTEATTTAPSTQVNVAVGGQAGSTSVSVPFAKGSGTVTTEKVVAENSYTAPTAQRVTLADRQTVRDLERLFGRPLRIGGAQLADQRIVAQLIADKPVDHFLAGANEAARKDREALAQVADAVVEILISSRALTTPGLSGDEQYTVPDIQATVVRLKDGAILAQASSSDVLGKDRYAGALVRTFDVNDIAEATALALMEDLAATAP